MSCHVLTLIDARVSSQVVKPYFCGLLRNDKHTFTVPNCGKLEAPATRRGRAVVVHYEP